MLYDISARARPPWFTEAARYHPRPPSRRRQAAASLARILAVVVLVLLLTLS
ncbi:MAG: hypothetical protein JOY82_19965 [Streptosporangiaceae bacterium]|nr:hypothetical protein [Streptosporangiaceae bacterium]